MSIIITKVTIADLPTLIRISRETFADTFSAENTAADLTLFLNTTYSNAQLQRELKTNGTSFWFVKVNGKLAGYLKLNINSAQSEKRSHDTLEIERIYILPAFKRQGLGTRLLGFAQSEAIKQGKSRIWLGVWEHNEPAKKFYQKQGFQPIGDHIFQLGSDPQRDILMEKLISD
ncbi:GNAT family N-acetyltransferase [Lacticaseibacillus rhamnosus]|uniref:GNAT family N-acetyltransferase n=1 Tax=Lacticaseibacillus rhamnosus TaxID=47715 RepID=UPI0007DF0831|nr:GNAT family N-acetyltransferase [Lacticaseibacillus rhamnosus]OAU19445.1 acetyltransferase [Lacticaseibacillus rhamnosus]OAU21819.1 acetyltransferase [Lacticaseibacillus rhamnosus]